MSSCVYSELKHSGVIVDEGDAISISVTQLNGLPIPLQITLNGEDCGTVIETKREKALATSGKIFYTELNTKFGVFKLEEVRNLNLMGLGPQFYFNCYLDGKFAGTVDGPN
jgi:hypothetical protein